MMYEQLFESLLSVFSGVRPESGLLGHMVILYFIFWGTTILFSAAAGPFFIPTSNLQGSNSFPAVISTSLSLYMEYLAMVLIKIILTDVDASLSLSNAWHHRWGLGGREVQLQPEGSERSRGRTHSREVWLRSLGTSSSCYIGSQRYWS